jgi:hypothetical protein
MDRAQLVGVPLEVVLLQSRRTVPLDEQQPEAAGQRLLRFEETGEHTLPQMGERPGLVPLPLVDQ